MEERCLIVGEIMFGSEISYERLSELEEDLKAAVEEHMHALGAAHLDFDLTHDTIVFQSSVPECAADAVVEACEAMIPLMDEGVRGRMVCVRHGFEEITVCHFSPDGCEETALTEP